MKPPYIPQFLIAAPHSGSGKTSVSMGLMELLTRQGKKVQPFKCGPDYIDTSFHAMATGNPSINLDTFMASANHVKQLYACYTQDAEISIVEGMMGMFDGYDRSKGSSAEIAQLLHIPVVLIINAKSTAYSVAPLIYGFTQFNPKIRIAGVIFNRVGSDKHASMLKEACGDIGVECFGCIRNNNDLSVQSRYLGLDISPAENKETIHAWGNFIKEQVDIELLLDKVQCPKPEYEKKNTSGTNEKLRIAVARNRESFAFIYQETLRKFEELGTVLFFDPEKDENLPSRTDLLYLPGGYPEKRQTDLNNNPILHEIKEYAENGGRVLAECGGMIYLSEKIINDGGECRMAGVLPISITNEKKERRLALGYRQFGYNRQKFRGHEFHYTQISPDSIHVPSVAQVYNAKGEAVTTPIYRYKNVIASYTHLYLGETDILTLWND